VWVGVFDVGNVSSLRSAVSTASTSTSSSSSATATGSDVVVMVNGSLVNINSVMLNLSRSEDGRLQMEKELKSLQQESGLCSLSRCLSVV